MTRAESLTLTQTRIADGWWEAVLTGAGAGLPVVEASHAGVPLGGVEVTPVAGAAGRHAVRVPIPASMLREGVQTVLLSVEGQMLGQFTIIAGVPLEEDLRAEISLIRAELDLLKRAFQRRFRDDRA